MPQPGHSRVWCRNHGPPQSHFVLLCVWSGILGLPLQWDAVHGLGKAGLALSSQLHLLTQVWQRRGWGKVLCWRHLCLPFCFSPIFPSSVHATTIGPTAQTQRLGVILDLATSLPMSTSPHLLLHSPESEPPPSFPGCPEPPPKGSLPPSCFSSVCLPHSSQQETVEKGPTIFLTGHTDMRPKDFFS